MALSASNQPFHFSVSAVVGNQAFGVCPHVDGGVVFLDDGHL